MNPLSILNLAAQGIYAYVIIPGHFQEIYLCERCQLSNIRTISSLLLPWFQVEHFGTHP
jgi:hypothetical protein